MIYQIRANLLFDIEDEANDFYHDCEIAQSKTIIVNPGTPEAEHSLIEKILSNHELNPNQPSILLASKSNKPPPP